MTNSFIYLSKNPPIQTGVQLSRFSTYVDFERVQQKQEKKKFLPVLKLSLLICIFERLHQLYEPYQVENVNHQENF